MVHFRPSVIANRPISERYIELRFSYPRELPSPVPGQFLTLRVSDSPVPLLRRPFAFSDHDPEKGTAAIIYETRGRATELIRGLAEGAELDVLAPLGHPFPDPKPGARPVLLAGGAGLGPLLFFASRTAARSAGPPAAPSAASPERAAGPGDAAGPMRPLFLMGARSAAAIPSPLPSLDEAVEVHLATDDGSAGFRGTVVELCESLNRGAGPDDLELFVCGPNGMMRSAAAWAAQRSITAWVSMEQTMGCAVGACLGCVVAVQAAAESAAVDEAGTSYARVCTEGPVFDARSILWHQL